MERTIRVSPRYVNWGQLLVKHINSRLLASGRVKPVVYDKVYSLNEVTIGLDALEKRETWGKVIVRINEEQKLVAKL